jgi:hypothetical protein
LRSLTATRNTALQTSSADTLVASSDEVVEILLELMRGVLSHD